METLRDEFRERLSHHMTSEEASSMENDILSESKELLKFGKQELLENVYYCKGTEILNAIEQGHSSVRSSMPFESMKKLRPDVWEPYIEKDRLLRLKEENMATTDYYKCPKCKHRKSIVTQVQTRSADEPATTLVKCMVCGHTISF